MKVTRRQLRIQLKRIINESDESAALRIIPGRITASGETHVVNLFTDDKSTSPILTDALVTGVKTSQGAKLGDFGESLAETTAAYRQYFGDNRIVSVENTNDWQNSQVMEGELKQLTGAGDSFGIDLWASFGSNWDTVDPNGGVLDLTGLGVGISMKLSVSTSSGGLRKQPPSFKNSSGIKKMMRYIAMRWLFKRYPIGSPHHHKDLGDSSAWESRIDTVLTSLGITQVKANIDAINGSFNPVGLFGTSIDVLTFQQIGTAIHENIFSSASPKLGFDLSKRIEGTNSLSNQGDQILTVAGGVNILMNAINTNRPRPPAESGPTKLSLPNITAMINSIPDINIINNADISGKRSSLIILGHYANKIAQLTSSSITRPSKLSREQFLRATSDPADCASRIATAVIEDSQGFKEILDKLVMPGTINPEFYLLKMSPNSTNFGLTQTYTVGGSVLPSSNGLSVADYQNIPKVILKLPTIATIDMTFTKLLDSASRDMYARITSLRKGVASTTATYLDQIFGIIDQATANAAAVSLEITRSESAIDAADSAILISKMVAKVAVQSTQITGTDVDDGSPSDAFADVENYEFQQTQRVKLMSDFIRVLTTFKTYFVTPNPTGKIPSQIDLAIKKILEPNAVHDTCIRNVMAKLGKLNNRFSPRLVGQQAKIGRNTKFSDITMDDVIKLKSNIIKLRTNIDTASIEFSSVKQQYLSVLTSLEALTEKIINNQELFQNDKLMKMTEAKLRKLIIKLLLEDNAYDKQQLLFSQENSNTISSFFTTISCLGLISLVLIPFSYLEPDIGDEINNTYSELKNDMTKLIIQYKESMAVNKNVNNLSTDVFVNEPETLDDLGTSEAEGESQGIFDKIKQKFGSAATGAIDYVTDLIGKGKSTLDDILSLPSLPPAGALTEGEKLVYKAIIKEAKKRKKQILAEQNNRLYKNILRELLKYAK